MKPEEIKKLTTIRKLKPEEIPFVCNSWIKSYASSPFNSLAGESYPSEKNKEILTILDISNTIVVTPTKHPDLIIGYIVFKDDILEFLYVKFAYRKQGFAKILWEEAGSPKQCTHWARGVDDFAEKYDLIYCLKEI
jgi:hypothetical protein